MSRSRRNPAALSLLVTAVALLVLAAPAGAETRSGETTSPVNAAIPGEADLLGASASYDSADGRVTITATTRVAPEAEEKEPELVLAAALGVQTGATCALPEIGFPAVQMLAPYDETYGGWAFVKTKGESGPPANPALKGVNGATTTLVALSSELEDQPFDCALVATVKFSEPGAIDEVDFPIKVPPAHPGPPTTTTPSTTPAPSAPPAPAPGLLSILKSKPVTAKAGKWTKVSVKVSNTGGTAVGPISIKAKAPAGVLLRPGSLKIPALLPGQTWPVTLQVKLIANAKPKSTVGLTGTSGGLTAAGAIVIRSGG